MKILLKTIFKGDTYTIGKLYINDKYECDILEDKFRQLPATCPNTPRGLDCKCPEKVKRLTCIPAGTYDCEYTMSNRFKYKTLSILNVPHFIGIRLHRGNKTEDTEGCPLCGENKVKGKVINSRIHEDRLNAMFKKATENKEKITITVER